MADEWLSNQASAQRVMVLLNHAGLPHELRVASLCRDFAASFSANRRPHATTQKIVYAASSALDKTRERLSSKATVVDGADPIDLHRVLNDLATRGIGKLMVEGGGTMHTQFLTSGFADELHLVIAPFFVGDSQAPRFVYDGTFPWNRDHRARLAQAIPIGDVVLLRYALSGRFAG